MKAGFLLAGQIRHMTSFALRTDKAQNAVQRRFKMQPAVPLKPLLLKLQLPRLVLSYVYFLRADLLGRWLERFVWQWEQYRGFRISCTG